MKNQNPSHNLEVFDRMATKNLVSWKELCTTKCAPPHTLRNRILSKRQHSLDALPKRSVRFIYTLPSNH